MPSVIKYFKDNEKNEKLDKVDNIDKNTSINNILDDEKEIEKYTIQRYENPEDK